LAQSLAGRTILITGGTSGTGLAGTVEWHRLGAEVVVGSRSEERYTEVAGRLGGKRVHPFIADLGDGASLSSALDALDRSGIRVTDIVHFAAGGMEPILKPLLKMAAGLRRMDPGQEREEAIAARQVELLALVKASAATARAVNLEGPRSLIARLAPALPDGATITLFASLWSEQGRSGPTPAWYWAVADAKNRFEDWLDAEARKLEDRRVATTVLVAHIISDTSTGRLLDRNVVPLMAEADQGPFRDGYVTTAETVEAATQLLTEPSRPGSLRRTYLVHGVGLSDRLSPEVRDLAAKLAL
jgi:NAD(P)-dependent dehydrogenase (short-subunit alcohol dehydrogenase family)